MTGRQKEEGDKTFVCDKRDRPNKTIVTLVTQVLPSSFLSRRVA